MPRVLETTLDLYINSKPWNLYLNLNFHGYFHGFDFFYQEYVLFCLNRATGGFYYNVLMKDYSSLF